MMTKKELESNGGKYSAQFPLKQQPTNSIATNWKNGKEKVKIAIILICKFSSITCLKTQYSVQIDIFMIAKRKAG